MGTATIHLPGGLSTGRSRVKPLDVASRQWMICSRNFRLRSNTVIEIMGLNSLANPSLPGEFPIIFVWRGPSPSSPTTTFLLSKKMPPAQAALCTIVATTLILDFAYSTISGPWRTCVRTCSCRLRNSSDATSVARVSRCAATRPPVQRTKDTGSHLTPTPTHRRALRHPRPGRFNEPDQRDPATTQSSHRGQGLLPGATHPDPFREHNR